jgi:diguanylate cyclase (GGDEF)-like protein
MQATIRIPLQYLLGSTLLYALVATVFPAANITGGAMRAAAFLLPAATLVHRLIKAEIRKREEIERALRQQATHDPLTGLVNRAHFQDVLDRALARAERNGQHFGVAYIDLNDFKKINDQHGHHAGDLLLTEVANRIKGVVRAGDCAARFGGDEFVVLVDDRTDKGVYRLSERLREIFAAPFAIEGQELHVTASIGIALYPDHGKHGLNLLRAADKAMYRAKSSRNGKAVTSLSSAA